MSLHDYLLKINNDDAERVGAMQLDNRWPERAMVDRNVPSRPHEVTVCPIRTSAADAVRREVPAVAISGAGICQIWL